MATALSGEGGDEEKALEQELVELQKAKEEIVERARPLSEELTTVAQREDECRSKLHRLRTQKKQQQGGESWTVVKSHVHAPELSEIVDSGNATESEVNRVQLENVELKQALEEAAKQSKAESEKTAELETQLNETRCEVNRVQLENVELAAKQSKAESEKVAELETELNETRQRLSAVQERLTVAEQVTAATQQRALQELQESDKSEQLQLDLAPDQPAESTGLAVSFNSV